MIARYTVIEEPHKQRPKLGTDSFGLKCLKPSQSTYTRARNAKITRLTDKDHKVYYNRYKFTSNHVDLIIWILQQTYLKHSKLDNGMTHVGSSWTEYHIVRMVFHARNMIPRNTKSTYF
eukprot:SAG11_NODE_557_length_8549_cov_5.574675_4_plen_119_part_00